MRFMLASGNRHKLHEFRAILAPHEVVPMPAGIELPPEGETSFLENARGKASALARSLTGDVAERDTAGAGPIDRFLGDDSGLEVEALGWMPGVISSRYAGREGDDGANNAKLISQLEGKSMLERRGRFVCVLVAVDTDMSELVVRGEWWGTIAEGPRGEGGFGYDPVFLPQGGRLTVAELSQGEKDRVSHRARAGRALLAELERE